MIVTVLVKPWFGIKGELLDKVPFTNWWNVLVNNDLRLLLTEEEFSS